MINQSNLKKLQNLLKEKDTDIFVINRSDEYLNEYISPNAERLNFISKGGQGQTQDLSTTGMLIL